MLDEFAQHLMITVRTRAASTAHPTTILLSSSGLIPNARHRVLGGVINEISSSC